VITSGGGFSNRYARPSYQKKAVHDYLENEAIELPPHSYFNRGGRAYPDISAYGNNFVVIMGGQIVRMSGTSASTPVIASMITLWNDIRLANGEPPLGFINPLIYYLFETHPEAYTDVVIGDNKCAVYSAPCCKLGFYAAAGWDAVTGVGSPNFRVIADYLRGSQPSSLGALHSPSSDPSKSSSSFSSSKNNNNISVLKKDSEESHIIMGTGEQLNAYSAVGQVRTTSDSLFLPILYFVIFFALALLLVRILRPSWLSPCQTQKLRDHDHGVIIPGHSIYNDRFYGTLDE